MSKGKQTQKKKKTGAGQGILGFGIVFALYSVIFKPHTLGGLILAGVLALLFGAIIKVMAQGLDLSTPEKTPDSLANVAQDTGNPDVDALLQKGREMITEIRTENALIPDQGLTEKLNKLENLCSQLFRAVYEKPAKASQIRKFMDYYLPTTLKMVKGYRVLGERNLSGEDTAAARKRIDNALGVVLTGCQKQLDNLYKDDVLDITTDIDVLEQMLKRDGLTQSDLDLARASAQQAAAVNAAVNTRAQQTTAQASPVQQATAQVAPAAQPAPRMAPAAPAYDPTQWHTGQQTGVGQAVQGVQQQAQQHVAQVPTLHTESYFAGGEAVARQEQK